jgi:tripartite-type tricarboxylate transporter receptor subunit TctC
VSPRADYAVSPIPIAAPHLAAGTLVAIGVTAARRSPLLPDVPTLSEVGAEGFDFPIWYGLWAPAETPAPVVAELAAAVSEALRSPELALRFEEHGAEILRLTQTEFGDFVTCEVARAGRFALS